MTTNIRFEDWEAERMQDAEFRAVAEELEPAYQVTCLRIERGLTQKQLAELVGTKQSSIARLESGKSEPRLSFLRRVVEALGARLEVRIIPQEEVSAVEKPHITIPISLGVYHYQVPLESISYEPVSTLPVVSQTIRQIRERAKPC